MPDFFKGFRKGGEPIKTYTQKQLDRKLTESLKTQREELENGIDLSELWLEPDESGMLGKILPILTGILSLITLLVVIFKK